MPGFSRPQFRLRTLMLGVFVASLFFGFVAAAGWLGAYVFLFLVALVLIAVSYWTKRRGLGIIGGAWVFSTIVLSCAFALKIERWSGSGDFVVPVTVVDAENGRPIQGATVSVFEPYRDAPVLSYKTDMAGNIAVPTKFDIGGKRWFLVEKNHIHLGSHMIKVSSDGYRQMEVPLAEYTGTSCDRYPGTIPPVLVELKPID